MLHRVFQEVQICIDDPFLVSESWKLSQPGCSDVESVSTMHIGDHKMDVSILEVCLTHKFGTVFFSN